MKGVIIEGVSAIGKSTILSGLQDKISQTYPNSTKLFISEHYTQRMLEHIAEKGELQPSDIRNHVDAIIKNISTYQQMLDHSKFAARPSGAQAFATVERFLFTYLMSDDQPKKQKYSKISASRQLKKMKELNFAQYLIVASPDKLKRNLADTLDRRNEAWAQYVKEKGGIDKIAETSLEWQNKLTQLAKKYEREFPTKVITIDNKTYDQVVNEIFENEFTTP